MPPALLHIQGANVLNLLLLAVAAAWAMQRESLPKGRPIPKLLVYSAAAYVLLILVAGVRGFLDFDSLRPSSAEVASMTRQSFFYDFLCNPLKHLLLAFMLFDGMRNRRNVILGIAAIVAQVTVFSLMAVRYIPLGSLLEPGTNSQFESAFRGRFENRMGFHPNDVALAMVAGFWTLAAATPMLWRMGWRYRLAVLFCGPVIAFAIALTNSRAAYMAMVVIGLIFGLVRWRWLLIGIPLVALIVFFTVPGVQARVGLGFSVQDPTGMEGSDLDEITAGRWVALWPPTIQEIAGSPVFGQGRMTILRTSLYERICMLNNGECPSHPHNAYLEMLLDSGIVGLVPVLSLLLAVPVYIYRRRRRDIPLLDTAASVGLAGAGAILLMGLTGQTFWPREAVDLVLCVYALAMGAHVLGLQVPAAQAWRAGKPVVSYAKVGPSAERPVKGASAVGQGT
jgi:O-antigen ligase